MLFKKNPSANLVGEKWCFLTCSFSNYEFYLMELYHG